MGGRFSEEELEDTVLGWLQEIGYSIESGPALSPGVKTPERDSTEDVVFWGRLERQLAWINRRAEKAALDEAVRKLRSFSRPSLIETNRELHRWMSDGIDVQYRSESDEIKSDNIQLVDYDDVGNNQWLAVNQLTVTHGNCTRRADVVLYLNGLPVAVFELKNPASDDGDVVKAYHQLQTYKREVPQLFWFNAFVVASDGLAAWVGSLTADRERFQSWKRIDDEEPLPPGITEIEVLLQGLCDPRRITSYLRSFIAFEDDGGGTIVKKIAQYHQFYAVQRALQCTLQASGAQGDRRAGVIWHTQGSGKSLTMLFYAASLVRHPEMKNPTIVVITDRNDLDDQLFGTFAKGAALLRQTPDQATDRDKLKALLDRTSGGVIFTTIQKFLPEGGSGRFEPLSDRSNVIVIADEAHRSQYGFSSKFDDKTGALSVGFAQHMRDALPQATFIGFTGTPVELTDRNTRAVFGDYISIYDIQQAVEDKATVPIFYESRMAKLRLNEECKPTLDAELAALTEGEEEATTERLKTKWAALEALVGSEQRLDQIAQDFVQHFELRQEALGGGKAMIVCMSRRICIALYRAIEKIKPEWFGDGDDEGIIKVVMTGSASDAEDMQPHVRNSKRRKSLADRFKNPSDPFRIVIVRNMWLTGFDAPSLNTMYVDKPMKGADLMQAIARVNRVFKDKPGGLIVDYLGIADQLKEAMGTYTASNGRGKPTEVQADAVAVMLEKYELCCNLFHGFEWEIWTTGSGADRMRLIVPAMDHILGLDDGKNRFSKASVELAKAFALASPHEKTVEIRDGVAFFQTIRAALNKNTKMTGRTHEESEFALQQLVSRAVASDGMIDVFKLAGLDKPDISVLSDEFLLEVKNLPQRNLAVELLAKLLGDKIKSRSSRNLVQSRSFAEQLEKSIQKYQNRAIETAQIIEELIGLAKDMNAARARGEQLNLTEDEEAFYDALSVSDSAVQVLGDKILCEIARDLKKAVKENLTIDWQFRKDARAKLRLIVKKILKKYGYPPDKRENAVDSVIKQAESFGENWTGGEL